MKLSDENPLRGTFGRATFRARRAIAVCFICACLPGGLWAAVVAELDRTTLTEGETVTLTFRSDNPRQKLQPDLSSLEEDFRVLDQRSETQLSIVNGKQTAVVRLLVTLEPKRSGNLQIPSLNVAGETTAPISVSVQNAPELAPGELPPVFIEVELLPEDGPYFVHAQFGLVVRVYYLPNLSEAAIGQPSPSPASVRLLQETPFQAERGGERYRVLERHYAVFPERSGTLEIPPMQLTGRLVERQAGSAWQPRVRGRRISVESEPLVVEVQAKPSAFTGGNWQPARGLQLSQQVSATDSVRVGEPVTRTVIVDAIGLEENMIIEPEWPDISNARIYPDQPQGITRDDGKWVLGHKEFRYAVVPEVEGPFELPELRVSWWDTVANQQREAVLPARSFNVEPSGLVPASDLTVPGQVSQVAGGAVQTRHSPESFLWRLATAVFATLWLLTGLLWWRSLRHSPATEQQSGLVLSTGEQELLSQFRKAAKAGDASKARKALRAWVRAYGPDSCNSILEFAVACGHDGLASEIRKLDALGFRPGSASGTVDESRDEFWNGLKLVKFLDDWREASGQDRGEADLTDLYARARRV